ncbi:hypothetical protein [Flagellimonas iocasae]|uniref:Cardiolipin synthetase n=1 Tax=Flagellimonas iocasae TaxID=2055905 RepID=A0ABW4Y1J3_9FLAO
MKAKNLVIGVLLLMGCSSTKLVSTWKNPDIVLFDAHKVLVVGLAQDENVRMEFETRLVDKLEKEKVEAMRSIDVFDVEFTSAQRSEAEIALVEQQLLDKDFDAILFTKIVGTENKKTLKEKVHNIDRMFKRFNADYLEHQDIYYDTESNGSFNIYHVETSLYCICDGKEIELVWRGDLDVTQTDKVDKTIDTYIKLITDKMGEQEVIFY